MKKHMWKHVSSAGVDLKVQLGRISPAPLSICESRAVLIRQWPHPDQNCQTVCSFNDFGRFTSTPCFHYFLGMPSHYFRLLHPSTYQPSVCEGDHKNDRRCRICWRISHVRVELCPFYKGLSPSLFVWPQCQRPFLLKCFHKSEHDWAYLALVKLFLFREHCSICGKCDT